LTGNFPDEEKFGIISQLRRCSVSVPSNIAEGAGRNSNKEFAQFLSISQGSIFELETQLELSNRFGFLDEKDLPVYFGAADLVVLPYRTFMSSSGPLSLAQAMGKPFILSEEAARVLKTQDFKESFGLRIQ